MTGSLFSRLPPVRGRLRAGAELAKTTWFQVGGPAEVLFRPEDADDLAAFLAACPADMPVTVLGASSNLLVRDGGIAGVVIRLGGGFTECRAEDGCLVVGAGCLNGHATQIAQMHGIGGLEFLSGVPGVIGGALAMNAGAYGSDTNAVLLQAEALDRQGMLHIVTPDRLGYSYRHCSLPEGWIFTRAVLQGVPAAPEEIAARMAQIAGERAASQPVRSRTGGSTFKNPPGGLKAWQLIDAAGCRGFQVGAAQMSELHCNFMINTGGATAAELEALGEEVRARVLAHSGVTLEWEIKRIGMPAAQQRVAA